MLYIIRHGKTAANIKKIVANDAEKLNQIGIKDSKKIGKSLRRADIDFIISSPLKRASETAQIISTYINKKIIISPLVQEKRLPSEINGMKKNNTKTKRIFKLMEKNNILHKKWHYSDEENYVDLQKRVKLFVKYLNKNAKKNILIISHEYFIKALLFILMCSPKLDYSYFRKFYKSLLIENSKITICKNNNTWVVQCLNISHI